MANSGVITDYLGYGTLASRPSTPGGSNPVPGVAVYYATDTATWYGWTGSAWALLGSGGSGTIIGGGPPFQLDPDSPEEAMSIPGSQGPQGNPGSTGATGPAGPVGAYLDPDIPEEPLHVPGPQGAQGNPGTPGSTGSSGPAGPTILIDADIPDEPLVIPGAPGAQGNPGATGPVGPAGVFLDVDVPDEPLVIPGAPGPAGNTGATGPQGAMGLSLIDPDIPDEPLVIPGAPGPAGNTGATGPQGAAAPQIDPDQPEEPLHVPGPQGPAGNPGNQGASGVTLPIDPDIPEEPWHVPGPQGPQGNPGNTGASGVTLPIDPDIPEEPWHVPGPQGPQGNTGPAGPPAVPGGYPLDPDIPEEPFHVPGPQGPQGNIGPTGPNGPAGIFLEPEYPDDPLMVPGPAGAAGTGGGGSFSVSVHDIANANYTATTSDFFITNKTTLTAARTITFPAASTKLFYIIGDLSGSCTPTDYIQCAPNGTDDINGANADFVCCTSPYVMSVAISDGVSNWDVYAAPGLTTPMPNVQTISSTTSLTVGQQGINHITASGGNVDLKLPAGSTGIAMSFTIRNVGSSNNVIVQNSSGTTITTVQPGMYGQAYWDGQSSGAWWWY